MQSTPPIRNHLTDRAASLILLFVTALGLYLRLRNLGELGFQGDEDLTALTVKGILQYGYPLFPSGVIYIRSLPLDYLLVVSTSIFGFNELALRIPSALLGTGTILLAYLFARRLFGTSVGLMVAAIISVSFYELEMARYARMYASFAFFYLLTVFAFYRYYVEGKGRWRWATTLLAILTITIHTLGFTLALFFLIPLLFRDYRTASRHHLIMNFGIISIFAFFWFQLIGYFFNLPLLEHQVPGMIPLHQEVDGASALGDATEIAGRKVGKFLLPSLVLVGNLYRSAFPIFAVLTVGCAAVAILYLIRAARTGRGDYLILVLIAVSSYLYQFNFVLLFFFAYLFVQNEGLLALRHRQIQILAGAIGGAFVFWVLCGLFLGDSHDQVIGNSTHLHQTVKALLDYPRFEIVWQFVQQRPIMSVVTALGFFWCFHVSARKPREKNALFLLLAFFMPLFTQGLFSTDRTPFRYNLHLDSLYFVLFALGLTRCHALVELVLPQRGNVGPTTRVFTQSMPIRAVVWGVFVVGVLVSDLDLVKSWTATERARHDQKKLFERFNLKYKDFKTTGIYIKERLMADDIVMVVNYNELYNYIGRVDYRIGSTDLRNTYLRGGQRLDIFIGSRVITRLETLRRFINERNGQRVWIVAREREEGDVRDEIANFVRGLSEHVVYVGVDQQTKVYLLGG